MKKNLIREIFIFTTLLFGLSMFLLLSVDWKAALGVLLFGWMMNIENDNNLSL